MNFVLTPSDVIEIIGIIASIATSIVAIVISLKTLKQNSKMIEESTRPYITMYIGTTYFSSTTTYLIMKNFGSSSAIIINFMSETDLSEFTYDEGYIPFSHIIGSQLSPGESHAFPIKVTGKPRDIAPLVIHISYKSNAKLYEETISLNFASDFDKLHLRANTRDQHLKEISFALQDIAEKML